MESAKPLPAALRLGGCEPAFRALELRARLVRDCRQGVREAAPVALSGFVLARGPTFAVRAVESQIYEEMYANDVDGNMDAQNVDDQSDDIHKPKRTTTYKS